VKYAFAAEEACECFTRLAA
jgi:transposase